MYNYKKSARDGLFGLLLTAGVLACQAGATEQVSSTAQAITAVEPSSVFDFEDISQWSTGSGSLAESPDRVSGAHSLAWQGGGYAQIQSVLVHSDEPIGDALTVRLKLPVEQPNPYWLGQIQALISVPSEELNNYYLGAVELTGMPLGQFLAITIPINGEVQQKLNEGYDDLSVTLVLNVPYNASGEYLLDDLNLSPTPELPDPIARTNETILGFDAPLGWASPGASLNLVDEADGPGEFLEVEADGTAILTSDALRSLGAFEGSPFDKLSVSVRSLSGVGIPSEAHLAFYLDVPSMNIEDAYVGKVEANTLSTIGFSRISLALSEELIATLHNADYLDLRVRIELHAGGGYALNNMALGSTNRGAPPPPDTDPEPPEELDPLPDDIVTPPAEKFPGKPQGPAIVIVQ